jgi:hypothetical protein
MKFNVFRAGYGSGFLCQAWEIDDIRADFRAVFADMVAQGHTCRVDLDIVYLIKG